MWTFSYKYWENLEYPHRFRHFVLDFYYYFELMLILIWHIGSIFLLSIFDMCAQYIGPNVIIDWNVVCRRTIRYHFKFQFRIFGQNEVEKRFKVKGSLQNWEKISNNNENYHIIALLYAVHCTLHNRHDYRWVNSFENRWNCTPKAKSKEDSYEKERKTITKWHCGHRHSNLLILIILNYCY